MFLFIVFNFNKIFFNNLLKKYIDYIFRYYIIYKNKIIIIIL